MRSKVALITGVSRPLGLGLAVARQLAELNYHVILAARNLPQAEALADELRQAGRSATTLRLDLADRTSINEAAEQLNRNFDHLDVLVNNASHMPDFRTRSALDVDLDALHSVFEVNVFPGSVASHPERGDDEDDRSRAEATVGVVWAATLRPGGPTGGLFFDGKPMSSASL